MGAGVTWLRRALKRPSKSVKYLEAVSSTTFNLASPLPERAHVENEVSEARIVHKPFARSIDDPPHLLVMPLCDLVGDKEGFVVPEKLGYTITCHCTKSLHDKLLDGIRNSLVSENDGSDCLLSAAVRVFERES